jgi:hypothetical protein
LGGIEIIPPPEDETLGKGVGLFAVHACVLDGTLLIPGLLGAGFTCHIATDRPEGVVLAEETVRGCPGFYVLAGFVVPFSDHPLGGGHIGDAACAAYVRHNVLGTPVVGPGLLAPL